MNAKDHITAFLETYGLDLEESELKRTPERVTELFEQLFDSVGKEPPTISQFEVESKDMIAIQGIPFRSLCVHHLVPFFGTVDIAVSPDQFAAGFGSFIRVVAFVCAKPQLQERATSEIADIIESQLSPEGIAVRLTARQMCVELRSGVEATYHTFVKRGTLSDSVFSDLFGEDG